MQDRHRKDEPLWRAFLLALILLSLGLRVLSAPIRYFDADEFQHLHGAYSIAHGLVPFRDYFEHHTPWLHYGLSWLYPIWGESLRTVFAARYLMLLISAGVLYLTYRIGRRLWGADVGLLAAVLLSFTGAFVEKALEVRPDVPAALCALIGVAAAIEAVRGGQLRSYAVSGLAWGAAIMFTQKALFGVAGLGAVLAWLQLDWRAAPWRDQARRSAAFAAGVLLPMLATCAWFLSQGGLGPFLEYNFAANASWETDVGPLRLLPALVGKNPFVATLGLGGIVFLLADAWRSSERAAAVPLAVALSLVAGLFVIPTAFLQYFLPLLPLWCLFAAVLLWKAAAVPPVRALRESWDDPAQRGTLVVWAVSALLLAGALQAALAHSQPVLPGGRSPWAWMWLVLGLAAPLAWLPGVALRTVALALVLGLGWAFTPLRGLGPWALLPALAIAALALRTPPRLVALALLLVGILAFPFQKLRIQASKVYNTAMLREIEYVLEHTAPGEPMFTGWHGAGVFRPHAYFYFFLHKEIRLMLDRKQRGADVVEALVSAQPPLIEYDRAVQALEPVVQEYVRAHYEPTGVGVLWQRRDGQAP